MAAATANLGAHHAVRAVLNVLDRVRRDRLAEARPAAARIELRIAVKQRVATGRAMVGAVVEDLDVLAAEGPLGGRLAQDSVLIAREPLLPLILGTGDRFHTIAFRVGLAAVPVLTERRDRAGDAGSGQPTVAIRHLVQVLLVVVLGIVEGTERFDLGRNLVVAGALQLGVVGLLGRLGDAPLLIVGVEDGRAILGADVAALTHAL